MPVLKIKKKKHIATECALTFYLRVKWTDDIFLSQLAKRYEKLLTY